VQRAIESTSPHEAKSMGAAVRNTSAAEATVEQCEPLWPTVAEAAAFCDSAALPFACNRISEKVLNAGHGGLLPQCTVKQARAFLATVPNCDQRVFLT
jgi:hypothetical protein